MTTRSRDVSDLFKENYAAAQRCRPNASKDDWYLLAICFSQHNSWLGRLLCRLRWR